MGLADIFSVSGLRSWKLLIDRARYYNNYYIHERMVADRPRVDIYAQAIARHVKPGDVVVDLGTGTGVLSMLAARAGASKVYAIDISKFIELAKAFAHRSNYPNIEFVRTHSRKLQIKEKADVVVHEQMGNYIDEDDMISNITDLRDRVLRPGGRILPNHFKVFMEPVQLHAKDRVPFLWDQEVDGISFSGYKDLGRQIPDQHSFRVVPSASIDCLLSDPTPLFEFDMETMEPGDVPRRLRCRYTVTRPGILDGLCFFWEARFDESLLCTTHPTAKGRAYHWQNLLFRVPAQNVEERQEICFDMEIPSLANYRTWRLTPTPLL